MVKYWKISLSLKRGKNSKYKKQLDYINKTYKPHYLTISQVTYYDHYRSRPIADIEFIIMSHDAIHVLDDFIFHYPKILVTGGATPYEWSKFRRSKKMKEFMRKRQIKEKKIADKLKSLYDKRTREVKNVK